MTRNKFTSRRNRNDDYDGLSGLRGENGEKMPVWDNPECGENSENYPQRGTDRKNPWKKFRRTDEEFMQKSRKNSDENLQRKITDDESDESENQNMADFEFEKSRYIAEKLEFQAKKALSEENLPVSFAKLLCGRSEDETLENIAVFKKEFLKAIEAALSEKLKGSTPKTVSGSVAYDPFLNGLGY